MTKARTILIIILFIIMFGIIGKMDCENEQQYYKFCKKTYSNTNFLNN